MRKVCREELVREEERHAGGGPVPFVGFVTLVDEIQPHVVFLVECVFGRETEAQLAIRDSGQIRRLRYAADRSRDGRSEVDPEFETGV